MLDSEKKKPGRFLQFKLPDVAQLPPDCELSLLTTHGRYCAPVQDLVDFSDHHVQGEVLEFEVLHRLGTASAEPRKDAVVLCGTSTQRIQRVKKPKAHTRAHLGEDVALPGAVPSAQTTPRGATPRDAAGDLADFEDYFLTRIRSATDLRKQVHSKPQDQETQAAKKEAHKQRKSQAAHRSARQPPSEGPPAEAPVRSRRKALVSLGGAQEQKKQDDILEVIRILDDFKDQGIISAEIYQKIVKMLGSRGGGASAARQAQMHAEIGESIAEMDKHEAASSKDVLHAFLSVKVQNQQVDADDPLTSPLVRKLVRRIERQFRRAHGADDRGAEAEEGGLSFAVQLMMANLRHHKDVTDEDVEFLRDPATDAYMLRDVNHIPWLMSRGISDAGRLHADLLSRYHIFADTFHEWVCAIRDQYNPNFYHNWVHAFDVFQFCYVSVLHGVGEHLAHDDVLALLVGSIAHDVGHIGLTNPHLVRDRNDIALRYNDNSVLENMHASICFTTMMHPNTNFMCHIGPSSSEKIRKKVVSAILATDMVNHFAHTAKFTERVSQLGEKPFQVEPFNDESAEDRLELLEMTLHMADVGNCVRPWKTYVRVCTLLEEEFFRQGDREKQHRLPVLPLMNRKSDSLAAAQGFWIPRIVGPLLGTFTSLLGEVGQQFMANAQENQEKWSQLVAKYGKITAGQIVEKEFGICVEDLRKIGPLPIAA